MAIALGTLEYVLEEGARWNWFDDATIRDCAAISSVSVSSPNQRSSPSTSSGER